MKTQEPPKSALEAREILARQDPLSEREMANVLDGLVAAIKPHLHSMSLRPLNETEVIEDRLGVRIPIGKSFADLAHDDKFRPISSSTRGIFMPSSMIPCVVTEAGQDSGFALRATYKFWGLTRDGVWILVTVEANMENRNGSLRFPKNLTIARSTPAQICKECGITLHNLNRRLSEAVDAWVEERMKLYKAAEQLAWSVRVQSLMLDLIPESRTDGTDSAASAGA